VTATFFFTVIYQICHGQAIVLVIVLRIEQDASVSTQRRFGLTALLFP
jgi:hypothetical protein